MSTTKTKKDELQSKIRDIEAALDCLEKEEYEYVRLKDVDNAIKTRNKLQDGYRLHEELKDEYNNIVNAENAAKDKELNNKKLFEDIDRRIRFLEERDAIIAMVIRTKDFIEDVEPFLVLPENVHQYSRQRQAEISKILVEANLKYKRMVSFALWDWVKKVREKEQRYLRKGQVGASHVMRDKINMILEEGTRLSSDFDI